MLRFISILTLIFFTVKIANADLKMGEEAYDDSGFGRVCAGCTNNSHQYKSPQNFIKIAKIIGKDDRRFITKKSDEKKYVVAGNVYAYEKDCQACGQSSGTVVQSANIVITNRHAFFDKKCQRRNTLGKHPISGSSTKNWWDGYVFSIQENAQLIDYEIDFGELISACPGRGQVDDVAILKLKNKVTYSGSVITPAKLIVVGEYYLKHTVLRTPVSIAGYGITQDSKSEQEAQRRLSSNIRIGSLLKYHDGEPMVYHKGDTTQGTSGAGLLLFRGPNDDEPEMFSIHKGSLMDSPYNVSVGVRQEFINKISEMLKR